MLNTWSRRTIDIIFVVFLIIIGWFIPLLVIGFCYFNVSMTMKKRQFSKNTFFKKGAKITVFSIIMILVTSLTCNRRELTTTFLCWHIPIFAVAVLQDMSWILFKSSHSAAAATAQTSALGCHSCSLLLVQAGVYHSCGAAC